jgi:hypothetical protein
VNFFQRSARGRNGKTLAEKSDSLSDFVIRFRAAADVVFPPRPLGVRVRALLKFALRQCGLRCAGFVDVEPAGGEGPSARMVQGEGDRP